MTAANRCLLFFLGIALITALGIGMSGCGDQNSSPEPVSSMGQPPEENVPLQAVESIDDDDVGKTLAVEGEIVKQCPAVGCWFVVKDESGEVFVDLNPAGLHLERKRVGQKAYVTGRVVKQGRQFRLEAQHVQFETKQETAPEN